MKIFHFLQLLIGKEFIPRLLTGPISENRLIGGHIGLMPVKHIYANGISWDF